jgi:hypothetical protein
MLASFTSMDSETKYGEANQISPQRGIPQRSRTVENRSNLRRKLREMF